MTKPKSQQAAGTAPPQRAPKTTVCPSSPYTQYKIGDGDPFARVPRPGSDDHLQFKSTT